MVVVVVVVIVAVVVVEVHVIFMLCSCCMYSAFPAQNKPALFALPIVLIVSVVEATSRS